RRALAGSDARVRPRLRARASRVLQGAAGRPSRRRPATHAQRQGPAPRVAAGVRRSGLEDATSRIDGPWSILLGNSARPVLTAGPYRRGHHGDLIHGAGGTTMRTISSTV